MTTLALAALMEMARLAPPDAPFPTPAPPRPAVAGPLFPAGLRDALPPLARDARALLSARAPDVDPDDVRELVPPAAEAVFGAAADRGASLVDVFTDDGLRGQDVFFMDGSTLAGLDRDFELPLLYPVSGLDQHGRPFRILGLLLGRGRTVVLFDRGPFTYQSASFPEYFFQAEARVVQEIRGPGSLELQGLSVDLGLARPRLRSIDKISPGEARVESGVLTRHVALRPVVRRARP